MTLKLEEFATCCRCCLSTNVKTQPLFGASLGQMLRSVVPLEVNETDCYPQQICSRCIIKLSTSFNFCQSVKTSYQTLKEILEKSGSKNEFEDMTVNNNPGDCNNVLEDVKPINIPVSNNPGDCINLLEDVKPMLPSNEELDTVCNTMPDNLFIGFDDSSKHATNKDDGDNISTGYKIVANKHLFHCSHCPKHFRHKQEMEVHLMRDHKAPCSDCSKSISVLSMARHVRIHNKIKSYACSKCQCVFGDQSNLSKHLKTHTGELTIANRKGHLCSICGKLFRWHTSLCRHRRIHRKSKLICIVCFKQFGDHYTLKVHMASHTTTKPFKCDLCDRGFTQLCNLKRHKQMHSDEKPYKCQHCNREFRQKYVMLLHTRKHTGEKPYVCSQCQKCFTWRNSLLVHKQVHDRAKKSSIQNNDVEEDNDLKHFLNVIFLCMQCNEKFSSHELYEEHLKVHKEDLKELKIEDDYGKVMLL